MPDEKVGAGKAYKIIAIDMWTRPGDVGIEKVYRIRYKTKGGVVDIEDFTEEGYTEANIEATLTKLAQKHDKIKAL